MKCKICGFRTYSLPTMGKHYRMKHPNAMKHRKLKRGSISFIDTQWMHDINAKQGKDAFHMETEREQARLGYKFCSLCGAPLR